MTARATTLYYITDGTFSVEDSRGTLERQGDLMILPGGDAKFVPDDPTFPATVFRRDGVIELRVGRQGQLRLDEYLKSLARWLRVNLQQKQE